MEKPKIRIHDLSTNEIVDRQLNDQEYEQWLEAQKNKIPSVGEIKKSALAKLAALGLTEDEIAAL